MLSPVSKAAPSGHWKIKGYFNQVRPAHYGIARPNGQGFSADTLIWDIQHPREETA